MRRRSLLLGAPLLLVPFANRAEGGRAPGPPGQAPAEAFSARIALPGLASDGQYLAASVSAATVFQGGALLVTVTHGILASASAGGVSVFGRNYPLQPAGDSLSGFVGFGTEDPPGPATLSISVADDLGREATELPIMVRTTDWTVDYITIPPAPPPDPDAPPPPPPPPDEGPLLPGIYALRTGRRWTNSWLAPVPEPLRVTGYFGEQRSFNGGPVQGHHGGTDFGANFGTPIYSTNAGTVVMAGRYRTRGNLVVVDHGTGVLSLYGHMEAIAVGVGDTVAAGEVLGRVGSTGLSTGAHLHWELSVGGVLVDGLRWLDGSQGF